MKENKARTSYTIITPYRLHKYIFCGNTIIIICESNQTVINLIKTIGDVHLTNKNNNYYFNDELLYGIHIYYYNQQS